MAMTAAGPRRARAATTTSSPLLPAAVTTPPPRAALLLLQMVVADFDDDRNVSNEWDVPDDLGDAADGGGELGYDDDNGGNDAAGQLARQRAEAVCTTRMLTVAEGQGLVQCAMAWKCLAVRATRANPPRSSPRRRC